MVSASTLSTTHVHECASHGLQNKALKGALEKDGRSNTEDPHAKAKVGKLKVRCKKYLLLHMYQLLNLSGFKGWKPRGGIRTRSSSKNLMTTKKPNLVKYQRSIAYLGPKYWNALPEELQKAPSYGQFKLSIEAR